MPGPILQYLIAGTSIPSSPRTQSNVEQSRGVKEVKQITVREEGTTESPRRRQCHGGDWVE